MIESSRKAIQKIHKVEPLLLHLDEPVEVVRASD